MKVVKIICTVILSISWSANICSQSVDYLGELKHVFVEKESHTHYTEYVMNAENPVEFLLAGLFVTYKTLLSSQDMGTCVFTPSCSTYGIQSIQKKGLIPGLLNTFDRLTRCHPFAGKHYDFDPINHKLYDPVD